MLSSTSRSLGLSLLLAAFAACAGPADPPSPGAGRSPATEAAAPPPNAATHAATIDEAQLEKERLRFLTLAPPAPLARLDGLVSEVRRKAPGADSIVALARDSVKQAYDFEHLGNLDGADIETMAFLVLMQAARSAQEDLRAIMAGVKAINAEKESQRQTLEKLQRDQAKNKGLSPGDAVKPAADGCLVLGVDCLSIVKLDDDVDAELVASIAHRAYDRALGGGVRTKAELDAAASRLQHDLDAMSEMGEMESLRLQMAMDRTSKLMSTLSNLLKKISDTSSGIVQNLK